MLGTQACYWVLLVCVSIYQSLNVQWSQQHEPCRCGGIGLISEVQALLLKDLFAPESLQLGSRAQKPARGMDAHTSQKTFLLLHSYFLCVSQTE